MLEAATTATHMMDTALQKGQEVSRIPGVICPSLSEVQSGEWVAEVDRFVHNMTGAVTAGFMWPHYQNLVRISLCDNVISALGPLFLVSAVLGLCCFPFFGLLAEYDLEEWLDED